MNQQDHGDEANPASGSPTPSTNSDASPRIIEPDYLSVDQVAALFGVTGRTIRSWMSQGLIPYFRIGRTIRFRRQDVYEYLCQHCRN
jgi:excisionase family DNA binding protein